MLFRSTRGRRRRAAPARAHDGDVFYLFFEPAHAPAGRRPRRRPIAGAQPRAADGARCVSGGRWTAAPWVMARVIPPAPAGGLWWGEVRPQKPLAKATGMTRVIINRVCAAFRRVPLCDYRRGLLANEKTLGRKPGDDAPCFDFRQFTRGREGHPSRITRAPQTRGQTRVPSPARGPSARRSGRQVPGRQTRGRRSMP